MSSEQTSPNNQQDEHNTHLYGVVLAAGGESAAGGVRVQRLEAQARDPLLVARHGGSPLLARLWVPYTAGVCVCGGAECVLSWV